MKNISANARGATFKNVGAFSIVDDDVIMFGAKVGRFSTIEKGVKLGEGVEIGDYCLIEEGVEIGEGTRIRNHAEIRRDTRIGKGCYIDSGVRTSGNCTIGDNVTIRFNGIVCREAVLEDGVFIAPNAMTQYSNAKGDKKPGILIGKGAFIGTGAVIAPGIKIGEGSVVGTLTYLKNNVPQKWIVRNKQHPKRNMKIDQ